MNTSPKYRAGDIIEFPDARVIIEKVDKTHYQYRYLVAKYPNIINKSFESPHIHWQGKDFKLIESSRVKRILSEYDV